MTQDQSNNPIPITQEPPLTPEEREAIRKLWPTELRLIDQNEGGENWDSLVRLNRNLLKRFRADEQEAKAQSAAIQAEVAQGQPKVEQTTLAHWCGFPTDMTRCSPFFPMNARNLAKREYLEDFLITSANWGEIRYTGPKLSTYEEDVLLALLFLLEQVNTYREVTYTAEVSGYDYALGNDEIRTEKFQEPIEGYTRKTYTYRGPILPLLKILGISKPGQTNYKRILSALKRLAVAAVELSVSAGKTKTGNRRNPKMTQLSSMLSNVYWNEEKKELSATINPFFYETYLAGRVTLVDISKRMSLKGVNSKALYRFVQSQKNNIVFSGHFLTLADALNMDREQPLFTLRKALKTAIGELIRKEVLTKQSGFVNQDHIKLIRTSSALPASKKEGKAK